MVPKPQDGSVTATLSALLAKTSSKSSSSTNNAYNAGYQYGYNDGQAEGCQDGYKKALADSSHREASYLARIVELEKILAAMREEKAYKAHEDVCRTRSIMEADGAVQAMDEEGRKLQWKAEDMASHQELLRDRKGE